MSNQPDIIIVESCRPSAGDLVVLCTNESLSNEQTYELRGRLAEEFEKFEVKFLIVCGSTMMHFKKSEINEIITDYLKEIKS